MQKTGVFMLALVAAFSPGRANAQTPSPSPGPTSAPNPFCAVHARAIGPLRTADPEYRIFLNSSTPETLSAHLTMIGDSGAYDAYLPAITLKPWRSEFTEAQRTVVTLPPGASAKYVFVDSYALNGGQKVVCPTEPSEILAQTGSLSTAQTTYVAATFLQALPPMPCGKMYTPARARGFSPRTGNWGNKELNAKVYVFIDSDGHVVQQSIYKSSGVEGLDDEAMGSAQHSTYTPATFLCTPVVGSYLFSFAYRP
jgi:hypothetical protein